jgi:hypothetical protein
MSRPVSIRVNYTADAIVLRRLVEAIERDPRRSQTWIRTTTGLLNSAIRQLLNDSPEGFNAKLFPDPPTG